MLRIEIQSWNGIATLKCSGRIIFGVEVETLRTMVQSRHESCVRVNLSRVTGVDAAGLGLLVELQNWASETRRTLTLIDLSEPVWALVILTKLCASLDISYSDTIGVMRRARETQDEDCRRQLIA
jgi:ABC-type transporter Mla MlaB component